MTQDPKPRRCLTCGLKGNAHASWCAEVHVGPVIGRWVDRAACNTSNAEEFFPQRDSEAAFARAREVCNACPVRRECAEYALTSKEKFGIWGALTRKERRVEASRRARRVSA